MKTLYTLLFCFFALALSAQTTYTVDCPRQDSCFLVETSIQQATAQNPRPQVTISYRLFRTSQEFDAIIDAIRKAANAEISAGVDQSRALNAIADKIQAVKPKQ